MTDLSTNKPPIWFWIISVIALIWNAMGVMAYLAQAFITDEMIAALPEEQQAEFLYEHPAWYTALFAIAVFAGVLGCLALLLRKKWAYILLVISAICATIQQVYLMVTIEGVDKIMPIMIILIAIFLVWFAKNAISKTWIS
ncbi:hypothetical protein [Ichthyenterobacterium magnum]|uniref:Sugar transporter n=1 Tax=Ichthyenterobacterium magnum TaxID=1230530 RepID=A0A420DMA7_9FLAO|nr:hypothetical protein [Ichthyenterobacterium magnum]RKE95341.1 hypothetical protein BXY80_1528 [Ichthyenterobacterium magnum]